MYTPPKKKNETKKKNCFLWQHHCKGALHVLAGAGSCNYMDNDFFLAVSQAQPGKESSCLVISLCVPSTDQNYAHSRCSACVCRLKECV